MFLCGIRAHDFPQTAINEFSAAAAGAGAGAGAAAGASIIALMGLALQSLAMCPRPPHLKQGLSFLSLGG